MFKFEKLVFGDLGWGDELFIALIMTLAVSICSMGLGIFIAIFTAWSKLTYNRFLNFIASFYTTVIRGIPELLVIYLIFFGGSSLVMKIAKVFLLIFFLTCSISIDKLLKLISTNTGLKLFRITELIPETQVKAGTIISFFFWFWESLKDSSKEQNMK